LKKFESDLFADEKNIFMRFHRTVAGGISAAAGFADKKCL
jgi:hypothetical protein